MSSTQSRNASSYNINLRRNQAIVHSVCSIQLDIAEHLKAVSEVQDILDRVTLANKVDTLEYTSLLGILAKQHLTLTSVQAQLERTKEIVLADAEEIDPQELTSELLFDPASQDHIDFTRDRLVLLPLKIVPTEQHGRLQGAIINPSSYLPPDEDFTLAHHPVDCQAPDPNCYLKHWTLKSKGTNFIPRDFNLPYKPPGSLNRFHCQLPPPGIVHPALPEKSFALDRKGWPYFKTLQIKDPVYNPSSCSFGRVIKWREGSVEVEVTDIFSTERSFFQNQGESQNRFTEQWDFGSFVIPINSYRACTRLLAYVSPYTRSASHPFADIPPVPQVV